MVDDDAVFVLEPQLVELGQEKVNGLVRVGRRVAEQVPEPAPVVDVQLRPVVPGVRVDVLGAAWQQLRDLDGRPVDVTGCGLPVARVALENGYVDAR
jgi:hypothetical protein